MNRYVYIKDKKGVLHSYTVFDEVGNYLVIGHPATFKIIHKNELKRKRR